MAVWMLYIGAFAAVLSGVAWLAERGVRQLGWATRPVWMAAMTGSVAPLAALALAIATGARPDAELAAGAVRDSFHAKLNLLLLLGWAAMSLVFVAWLRLSAWTLRRNAFSWRTTAVAGEAVLVSTDLGPAVIGVRRPRVVVPGRVLAWEPGLQGLVVAHEREHVRARDHWLLAVALALLALLPWCLPLWWQFHRLREAIETDCDARVVSATGAARDYAGVLLALAARGGRQRAALRALPGLDPGVLEVERRIRRIVIPRRGSPRRGAGLVLAAAILLLVAVSVIPRPGAPELGIETLSRTPTAGAFLRPPASMTVILGFTESDGEPPEGAGPEPR